MNLAFRGALGMAAALLFFQACNTGSVERLCPALPQIQFTPDPAKPYGTKDNVLATITPFGIEDGDKYACPATVCFTLDGSEPIEGRATTHCLPAPVKEIPIRRSTCIKYYVVGVDGSQSAIKEACYKIEPPPVSHCDPKPKSSKDPMTIRLSSSKAGKIYYTLDGNDPNLDNPDDGITQQGDAAKVEFKIAEQGTTQVKFRAIDEYGNREEKINSCDYRYDSVPPETTAQAEGTNPIVVTLSGTEPANVYYTLDGSEPDRTRINDGSTLSALVPIEVKIYQSSYLRYYSVDFVGNDEEEKQESIYYVDNKPAVGVSYGTGSYSETYRPVELRASSAGSGTVSIYYTLDSSEPDCVGGGTEYVYGNPITTMNKEGEYTLKYIACDSGGTNSGVRRADYLLGATGNPFFRQVTFSDASFYDSVASSKSVEWHTRQGFARLRRKMPLPQGTGVNNITSANRFDFPQEIEVVSDSQGQPLILLASGSALRIYNQTYAQQGAVGVPEELGFFSNPCSATRANGWLLGVVPFFSGPFTSQTLNVATPYTNGPNCGGFAKWTIGATGNVSRAVIKPNQPQFPNDEPQTDPFLFDPEEVNSTDDPNLPNLPKAASAVIEYNDILFVPRYESSYTVQGYFGSTGNHAVTSSTALDGRAIAMAANNPWGTRLAVGDSLGRLYMFAPTGTTMALLDKTNVSCAAGRRCRVNDLAWYTSGGDTFVLLAIGSYAGNTTGQVGVAKVNANGTLALLTSRALPESDAYRFDSSVESIRVLASGIAVAAVREQGVVALDLTAVASGRVSALGYLRGSDIGDSQFWATHVAPFPTGTWAAVADAGRTATQLNAGFRILKFDSPTKWEADGELYVINLNNSGKGISRLKLSDAACPGCTSSKPLPDGLTIQIVADGTLVEQPLYLGTDISFPNQPQDIKAKLTFESTDEGASTVQIDYLQFKLTPVE